MKKTRVLIADDHTLFRRLLADMLEGQQELEVVGQAESGREAISLARDTRPDLILMDLRMPGLDGVETTRIVRQLLPSTAVLILTMSEEDEDLRAAMRAGAKGYLLKNVEPADLVRSICLTTCGHAVIDSAMANKLVGSLSAPPREKLAELPAVDCSGLTGREKEILALLSQGATNKAIARSVGITEATVKAHVHSILNKLHLDNRVQAAKWAMENRLAQSPDL